jgi:hypothetical protein
MTAESVVSREIIAALGKRAPHVRTSRNNVGMAIYPDSAPVKYGLFGDVGGSDRIGWTTKIVTPEMVGQKVAIFTAIEIKKTGEIPNTARVRTQRHFCDVVRAAGGIAGIVQSAVEALALVGVEP